MQAINQLLIRLILIKQGYQADMRKRNMVYFTGLILMLALGYRFINLDRHHAGNVSPWGLLEKKSRIISVPIELIPALQTVPARNPWYFPASSRNEVSLFLEKAPVSGRLRRRLISGIAECAPINGCVIFPSAEDVLALPPEGRAWIYNWLSRYEMNKDQARARRYPCHSMKEWLKGIPLSASTVELLEKLAYRNNSLLFFADIPLSLSMVSDNAERLKVYKALNRVEVLQLNLRVPASSDLTALTDYWGVHERREIVRPILESLQESGDAIDFIHLLPPLPRNLLYRFPIEIESKGPVRNCFWTAMNFFSEDGETYDEVTNIQDIIVRDYHCIMKEQLRFGDLVVYVRDDAGQTKLIHAAAYICDNVVFTKNGTTWSSPWMYMHLENMDDYYSQGVPLRRIFLRRKS